MLFVWGCACCWLRSWGRCDAEDEDERTRVGSENREQGARESRPLRSSQRFALWSVTRGADITGGWAVMSGWTVITARLNIGWSSVCNLNLHPMSNFLLTCPPAGFEKPWLVTNTEQTYPAVPIQTWEPFYVDSYTMQCNATKEPPTTTSTACKLDHPLRSRANPPF